jgi:ATP-binding cassette subfamily B protein/subfamily B ATP-binding cassette protein MsbA
MSTAILRGTTRPLRRQLPLLRYALPHWRLLTVVVTTMLCEIGLQLLRPWPLKLLVDNVIGSKAIPPAIAALPGAATKQGLLGWVVGAELVVFLAGTVANSTYTYAELRLGQRMTWDLAGDLFRHLQRLSMLFHSRRPVGDMIERVTGDSYCVNTIVTEAAVPLVQALVTVVAMFVIMWKLEPALTLVAVGVIPFLVIVVRTGSRSMRDTSRDERDMEGEMSSVVEQTLSAIPAVQSFTREDHEDARFRRSADETVTAYSRATFAGMRVDILAGLVTTVGTAAVMYIGGSLAIQGKLTAGTIIVFLSYLTSLYDPLDALTQTTQTVMGASAAADRVMDVFEVAPDIQDRPGAREAEVTGPIRFKDVSFGYEPGEPVLRGISLEAGPGDVLAIVGPTGAGKTTLVNLLVRFFDPWSGRITAGGVDIRDFRHRSWRRQIALVLQDPFLFPITIADNIAWGEPAASRERIVAAAEAANADEFIRRLPEGYDTTIGEKGATLSGGQKQRLSIARAFLKDAPVLVLDEPTSALDAHTEALLLEALTRLMAGRITFVVAHRLSTIRDATQILVLRDGAIAERGTHDALIAAGGEYAALYAQQVHGVRRTGGLPLVRSVPGDG